MYCSPSDSEGGAAVCLGAAAENERAEIAAGRNSLAANISLMTKKTEFGVREEGRDQSVSAP